MRGEETVWSLPGKNPLKKLVIRPGKSPGGSKKGRIALTAIQNKVGGKTWKPYPEGKGLVRLGRRAFKDLKGRNGGTEGSVGLGDAFSSFEKGTKWAFHS